MPLGSVHTYNIAVLKAIYHIIHKVVYSFKISTKDITECDMLALTVVAFMENSKKVLEL